MIKKTLKYTNGQCSVFRYISHQRAAKIFASCADSSESSLVAQTQEEGTVKRTLSKRPQSGFQDQLSLNGGQKYCRMLQGEHSAILSTFNKLPFVIKIFVLSILEWPFYTGFTVRGRFRSKFAGYVSMRVYKRSLCIWKSIEITCTGPYIYGKYMGVNVTKPFFRVCDKARLKPVSSSTETS